MFGKQLKTGNMLISSLQLSYKTHWTGNPYIQTKMFEEEYILIQKYNLTYKTRKLLKVSL